MNVCNNKARSQGKALFHPSSCIYMYNTTFYNAILNLCKHTTSLQLIASKVAKQGMNE